MSMESSKMDTSEAKEIVHLKFGAKAVKIVGKDQEEIKRLQASGTKGAYRVESSNYVLQSAYLKLQDKMLDYEYRDTDVFVTGFMKSGTTFAQEIVWTILHNLDNNNTMQDKFLPFDRVPPFDISAKFEKNDLWHRALCSRLSGYLGCDPKLEHKDMIKLLPNPRVYKYHIIPDLMDPKLLETSKVIYIIRNPLDTFISYYHYARTFFAHHFKGDMQEFLHGYINDIIIGGTSPCHVKAWWPYMNHKNVHFVFYEDLKKFPVAEIKKIGSFLGKDLTDEQINHVQEKTKFSKMQEKFKEVENSEITDNFFIKEEYDKCGGFYRKGDSGNAKELPDDIYRKLAEYCKDVLKDIDLPYKY